MPPVAAWSILIYCVAFWTLAIYGAFQLFR